MRRTNQQIIKQIKTEIEACIDNGYSMEHLTKRFNVKLILIAKEQFYNERQDNN